VPPLDGVRIVEAGLLVQGPQAAALLGAWGAAVIKVELPGFGDQARWLPVQPGDPRSAYFTACNRGKRSITLDMRRPAGRDVFLRLADAADVVISNFTPGTMEAWGLGYDVLADRNARVVYAAGSTFGPEGPDAMRPGNDLSGQAAGGLISTTGAPGDAPTPVGATIADHIASQNLACGVLAALFARERTGRGQRVDTSLLGGQLWAQASEITACLLTGRAAGRANRGNPLIPGIFGIFSTSDGWIALAGVSPVDRARFYDVIGRADLNERFADFLYWDDTKAELFPILDEVFATRTTQAWCDVLDAAGIRCVPVRDHAAVVEDANAWANGYLASVDGATVVAPPVRFSDTPADASGVAPELGQHTEEILLELGYSWDDITAFSDANVT
jgi:crotonobetainyl-CoA:carnitine CoA-transferase CaiB-like acyl-CoA transferase